VPEHSATVELPDRVTVLTCIGCGAMGRQERCEGQCSEHRLVLVSGVDHEALLAAAAAARARAARLAPIAREAADAEGADPREALTALRESARRALRDDGPEPERGDWSAPDTVTGWWCAECGNVDMPQPCIGVCIWRPADWINLAAYERQFALAEPALRGARSLRGFVARAAAVTPRDGQWERNRTALQAQARAALADHAPAAPAPQAPAGASPRREPGDAVQVHIWPP
jgi:hypothetical protein